MAVENNETISDMKNSNIIPLCIGSYLTVPLLQAGEKMPPNIVLIMTDQQRADLLAREDYPLNTMPFLDGLASQGTWFDKAYTSSPASVPARTSLLTGRYPKATHVRNNQNLEDVFFDKDMFHLLEEQGYATALVGKNHTYLAPERLAYWSEYNHGGKVGKPNSEKSTAFDQFLKETQLYASFEPSPGGIESQPAYRVVDEATAWIRDVKEKPFMLWLSFAEPHNPYQTCEPYFSMFKNQLPLYVRSWGLRGRVWPNEERSGPRRNSYSYSDAMEWPRDKKVIRTTRGTCLYLS